MRVADVLEHPIWSEDSRSVVATRTRGDGNIVVIRRIPGAKPAVIHWELREAGKDGAIIEAKRFVQRGRKPRLV